MDFSNISAIIFFQKVTQVFMTHWFAMKVTRINFMTHEFLYMPTFMTHEFLQSLLSWPISFPRKSSEWISCPWIAIKQHFMGYQFICFGRTKLMGHEYSLKSVAHEFHWWIHRPLKVVLMSSSQSLIYQRADFHDPWNGLVINLSTDGILVYSAKTVEWKCP